jgi:hypothetical protein
VFAIRRYHGHTGQSLGQLGFPIGAGSGVGGNDLDRFVADNLKAATSLAVQFSMAAPQLGDHLTQFRTRCASYHPYFSNPTYSVDALCTASIRSMRDANAKSYQAVH